MIRHFLLALILLLLMPCVIAVLNVTGTITMNTGDTGGLTVTFNDDSGSSSSGGGGGGGGAGGDPNTCFIANPGTSHVYDSMKSGEFYTLKSFSNQFMFKKVSFSVEGNHTAVIFKLSHVLNIACETVPAVGTDVDALGYERIDYVGISPDTIIDVTINFTITDDMLQGANPEEVQLYRYHDSNWERAPTSYITKVGGEHYFFARPEGMSMFSVVVPKPSEAPAPEQGNDITGDVTTPPAVSPDSGSEPTNPETETENTGSSTLTETKRFRTSWFSIIVVLIIGGALGGYYVYDYRKKIQAVNDAAEKGEVEHKPMMGVAEIDDQALKDPVEQVHDYVDKELRHGHTREEIATHLEKSGWPKDVIARVIDDFRPQYLAKRGMLPHDDYEKVLGFLKEKLDKGYEQEMIKQSMTSAGWDEGLINALLADLTGKNEKLIAYISSKRTEGKSDEEIRTTLSSAGWTAEQIDAAMRSE